MLSPCGREARDATVRLQRSGGAQPIDASPRLRRSTAEASLGCAPGNHSGDDALKSNEKANGSQQIVQNWKTLLQNDLSHFIKARLRPAPAGFGTASWRLRQLAATTSIGDIDTPGGDSLTTPKISKRVKI